MLNTVSRVIRSKPKPPKPPKTKRRKKKTPRQLLERQLDVLVREIVLARDCGCVTPAPKNGHSTIRQPGHLLTRGFESVKWDLYNVNEQCSYCNGRHEHYSHYYRWWFKEKFGEDEYNRLDRDAQQSIKMSLDDLEGLYMELIEIQKLQEARPGWKPYFTQKEIISGKWRGL